LRIVGAGLFALGLVLSAVWANLAIAYQMPGSAVVRVGACLVFDVIALAALLAVVRRRRSRWRALLVYAVACAIFLGWSSSISASNDKNWAVDVAHGVTGAVDGDQLTVRNLRNFSWRTEADYAERWEQRTYDLSKLRSLDGLLDGAIDRPHDHELWFRGRALSRFLDRAAADAE